MSHHPGDQRHQKLIAGGCSYAICQRECGKGGEVRDEVGSSEARCNTEIKIKIPLEAPFHFSENQMQKLMRSNSQLAISLKNSKEGEKVHPHIKTKTTDEGYQIHENNGNKIADKEFNLQPHRR